MMQTKGSSESVGYTYSFDISNKTLKKVGVEASGLSSVPNADGSLSLVSSGGASPELFIINNKSTSSTKITANGLADKCVWLKDKAPAVYCAIPNQIPGGNWPDVWYKGLVSTEDFIEKIDVNNNIYYNVSNLSSVSGEQIDVVNMSLSPDGTNLIFRNKIDGYLWMLRIEK
jgi:hypothetical protein